MKGGNGATNRSGITQFAEGEPKSGAYRLVRRSGECVISFANAHSITAFHSIITHKKPYLLTQGLKHAAIC